MLSKKSPQTSCRIRIRNDRIAPTGFLNQRCAFAPDFESMLRARIAKIAFRQHRPLASISSRRPTSDVRRTSGRILLNESLSAFDPLLSSWFPHPCSLFCRQECRVDNVFNPHRNVTCNSAGLDYELPVALDSGDQILTASPPARDQYMVERSDSLFCDGL